MSRFRTLSRACAGLSAIPLLSILAWSSLTTHAAAQAGLALHVEGGGASTFSHHQTEVLGYHNGGTVMVRPELRLTDSVGLEANFGGIWLPAPLGTGRVFLAGAGVRFQPMLGLAGRFVIDFHANYARTGDLSRFAFDTGLAFEIQASEHFGIGPYIRYTHVVAANAADGADAVFLSYGLTLAIGPSPARDPHEDDSDEDGVVDADDVCVHEASGETPDSARRGCPLRDTDADGVFDRNDECVNEPVGADPSPVHVGCPRRDADHDGVRDADDQCPNEVQGAQPDPQRVGCPRSDADADGVFDREDLCPSVAAGAHPDANRAGCPDGDDDGDGFANSVDLCPAVHANATSHPDPARPGCPMADRDGDMVPDALDACPDVAGAPSTVARRNGCPGLVTVTPARLVIERPVYFATGRDTILRRSTPVLTALAETMRLIPKIRRVSIEGHTDDVGSAESNRDLSERRASSVMQWLIAHGVDATRLESHGVGETEPEAGGHSREAREQNRQVDFLVTDPAPNVSEGGSR